MRRVNRKQNVEQQLFKLSAWAWYCRKNDRSNSKSLAAVLLRASAMMATTSSIMRAAHDAVRSEHDEVGGFGNWMMSILPRGRVHGIDSTRWIVTAAISLLSHRFQQRVLGGQDGPQAFDEYMIKSAIEIADEQTHVDFMATELTNASVLHAPFTESLERVRAFLRECLVLTQTKKKAQVKAASLSPSRIKEVKDDIESAANRFGMLRTICREFGGVTFESEISPTTNVLVTGEWVEKEFLIDDPSTGVVGLGEGLGRSLAEGEDITIISEMAASAPKKVFDARSKLFAEVDTQLSGSELMIVSDLDMLYELQDTGVLDIRPVRGPVFGTYKDVPTLYMAIEEVGDIILLRRTFEVRYYWPAPDSGDIDVTFRTFDEEQAATELANLRNAGNEIPDSEAFIKRATESVLIVAKSKPVLLGCDDCVSVLSLDKAIANASAVDEY